MINLFLDMMKMDLKRVNYIRKDDKVLFFPIRANLA